MNMNLNNIALKQVTVGFGLFPIKMLKNTTNVDRHIKNKFY